mmetsp:Transcript_6754/g.9452  ORF Transcript_6754/g.9452 Transcript_6754/m.9452 type:complete len:257 (+) Transcript_6754:120-890(+)
MMRDASTQTEESENDESATQIEVSAHTTKSDQVCVYLDKSWWKKLDPATGRWFYVHEVTGQIQWAVPACLVGNSTLNYITAEEVTSSNLIGSTNTLSGVQSAYDKPKIIFLDIDGVLNRTERAKQIILDEDLCLRLQDLCERTGNVRIVLTTFWRQFAPYISYIFLRLGVTAAPVIGVTPGSTTRSNKSPRRTRAEEIAEYIETSAQEHIPYVILDDRRDAATTSDQIARFVRTDHSIGLTEENVNQAARILLQVH